MSLINILIFVGGYLCGFLPYMIILFSIIRILVIPYASRVRTAIYMFLLFDVPSIRNRVERAYRVCRHKYTKGFYVLLPKWIIDNWALPGIVFIGAIFLGVLYWLYLKHFPHQPPESDETQQEEQPESEPEEDPDHENDDKPDSDLAILKRLADEEERLRLLRAKEDLERQITEAKRLIELARSPDPEQFSKYLAETSKPHVTHDGLEKILEFKPLDNTWSVKEISNDIGELTRKIRELPAKIDSVDSGELKKQGLNMGSNVEHLEGLKEILELKPADKIKINNNQDNVQRFIFKIDQFPPKMDNSTSNIHKLNEQSGTCFQNHIVQPSDSNDSAPVA